MKIKNVKGDTFILESDIVTTGLYRIQGNDFVLIDPGVIRKNEFEEIKKYLKENKIHPAGIICTHAHVDHAHSCPFFKDSYGTEIAMPQIEADFASSMDIYRAVNGFPRGKYYSEYPHYEYNVDYIIKTTENSFTFLGTKFNIENIQGHTANNIGVGTPDNILYVGDTVLSKEVLARTKLPYVNDVEMDMRSKLKIRNMEYSGYILSHRGIHGSIDHLIEKNIEKMKNIAEEVYNLIEDGSTFDEIISRVNTHYSIGSSAIKFRIAEKATRSYIHFLETKGRLKYIAGETNMLYRKA